MPYCWARYGKTSTNSPPQVTASAIKSFLLILGLKTREENYRLTIATLWLPTVCIPRKVVRFACTRFHA
jgi:hypothetical protein